MRKEKVMEVKNKTDQFFREKLDQISFQPSEQAWEQVQNTIQSESTPWSLYLKIAAGFALILTIGVIIYTQQEVNHAMVSAITSPEPMETPTLKVEKKSHSEKMIHAQEMVAENTQEIAKEQTTTIQKPIQVEMETIEVAMIDEVIISTEKSTIEMPVLREPTRQPAVKITYYTARNIETSETIDNEQDTAKANLFDKMKFFAKNVSPVELLTDLRSVKEDLIENGFKRNE